MDEKTISLLLSPNNSSVKSIKKPNTDDNDNKIENINSNELKDFEVDIHDEDNTVVKHFKNKDKDSGISSLITSNHLRCGLEGLAVGSKLIRSIINNRVLPNEPLPESVIMMLINQLASLDSNNFVYKSHRIGVGEREGRVFSSLVKQRHYNLAHGVGRSGDLTAHQPKAAGSTLMYSITNALALSAIQTIVSIASFNLKNVDKKKDNSTRVDNIGFKKAVENNSPETEKDVLQSDLNDTLSPPFVYSSLLSKITRLKSSLFQDALVVPLSTGMCLTLVLREIANQRNKAFFNRPAILACKDVKANSDAANISEADGDDNNFNCDSSRCGKDDNSNINYKSILDVKSILPQYVIWSRIDQKTCLKCITAAGLIPVVVNLRRVPSTSPEDDLQSHSSLPDSPPSPSPSSPSFFVQCHPDDVLNAIKRTPGYPHSIIAVLTTTSCFAPRLPDPVLPIARICHQFGIPHVINNAYGLQSRYIGRMIHNTSASTPFRESGVNGDYGKGSRKETRARKDGDNTGNSQDNNRIISSNSRKICTKVNKDNDNSTFESSSKKKKNNAAIGDDVNFITSNFVGADKKTSDRLHARIDAFVQSTDKNFMVPVGGSVVVGDKAIVKSISALYPGRASASPIVDLFITLLLMGRTNYVDLAFTKRYELLPYFHDKMRIFAAERGESVAIDGRNDISFGVTLRNAYKTLSRFDKKDKNKVFNEKKNLSFEKKIRLNEFKESPGFNQNNVSSGEKKENIETSSDLQRKEKEENEDNQHLLSSDNVVKSPSLVTVPMIRDNNFTVTSAVTNHDFLSNNSNLPDDVGSDNFDIDTLKMMNEAAISIGSKLYHMGVTGPKVVIPLINGTESKTISGVKFTSYGMHGADEVNDNNFSSSTANNIDAAFLAPVNVPLLVMACAIGMEKHEVDMFIERLVKLYPI